ncbi:tetratricopeptide repeat protein 38-like isoform X2 [Limulus polyphemus]|uniref:Tetratricopeptide repeat protein 38 n=1 Tax=Limulus polyphemus TaxID=6850 RepID=A0ABM1B3V4_LIMPO|nr:tetratricopeptide repeat protein 38-like isoform X2 [Limulus polyphemus]
MYGGLKMTLENMKAADPNFVMGQVMSLGLDLISLGRTLQGDTELKQEIEKLESLSKQQACVLTSREQSHIKAVQLWADGYLHEATSMWDDILVDHPSDMFAIRMAYDSNFSQGHLPQMRDLIARVFPRWKPTTPLYSYLFGQYAFGLEETNFYYKAENLSRKGLELNPKDAWATHALAHVLEMEGRTNEGIAFMSSTVKNWEVNNLLVCHNFWHWAVYHIEQGELEAAMDIFDTQVGKKLHSGSFLDISDATALLYRLELEGAQVKDRWREVSEVCRTYIEDHTSAFNDTHIFMSCLGAKDENATKLLMNSLDQYIRETKGVSSKVSAKVGRKIIQALLAYDEERYEDVVSLLYPLRYEIVEIGGSNAQRDVFNLLLIHATLKSSNSHHHSLAQSLLYERKALKEGSPMTDRLMARVLALHLS